MRRDDALTLLRAQRDALRGFGVRSLSLFGSTARDEASADSDVDLLVEFEGTATFDAFMDVKLHLEAALGCRVDLATRKALRERLRPGIEREAILVA
jgi:uncharacterized protein